VTDVYITIDTEYSAGIYAREGFACRQSNFDRSIAGITSDGSAGISYQMDVFDRYGLKAVFFVDPMPALIWGVDSIADIVGPITERGHDVQLHLHTEWLEFAGAKKPYWKPNRPKHQTIFIDRTICTA
jgi:peptidoglycan/xylan/chitin deacetylase (PgdA/CDA1 family)